MVELKIKCKDCNEFFILEVDESKYFKWVISRNPEDLGLSKDEYISFITYKCKYCRSKS